MYKPDEIAIKASVACNILWESLCKVLALILRTFTNERPRNSLKVATSRFPTLQNYFYLRRSRQIRERKALFFFFFFLLLLWEPFFSLPCTVFWGVKTQKLCLKRGVKRQRLCHVLFSTPQISESIPFLFLLSASPNTLSPFRIH